MPNKTRTLSESMIERMAPPKKGIRYEDVWDAKQNGLFVRIGKRTKTFYCYDSKTRTTVKIGPWGADRDSINVNQARERASSLLKNRATESMYLAQTLGYYLDNKYRIERVEKPVREETIKKIKSDFSDWLLRSIQSFTADMLLKKIDQWRNGEHKINTEHHSQRHKKPVKNSDSTIRKKVVQIKAVFNTLVKHKHIRVNPFADISFKKDKRPKRVSVYSEEITYDDVMRFILQEDRPVNEQTSKYRKDHSPAARIFIATVIRLGLRDAEARLNYINNFITTGNNTRLIIPREICKTKTEREVPITCPILLEALNTFKNLHHIENNEGLMFFNPSTNKAYTSSLGRKLFEEIKEEFGLGINGNGSGRKYDFRHTFATRLYNETGDLIGIGGGS